MMTFVGPDDVFDCLFEPLYVASDEPERVAELVAATLDWFPPALADEEPLPTPSAVHRTTMPVTSVTTAIMLMIATPLRPMRWISRSILDVVTYVSSRTGSTRGSASPRPLEAPDVAVRPPASSIVVGAAMTRVVSGFRPDSDADGGPGGNRPVEPLRASKT